MKLHRGWLPLAALATTIATPAFAQDVATAAALFDKGVADMQENKFDSACPSLAESLRLDRRAGTLFTLAECFGKAGKTASAVARYQDYLDLFARMTPEEQQKQHGRERTAEEMKSKLAPTVPMLTLKLPDGAPPGTEVKRDGILLGGAIMGLPLPVDPGAHTITTQPPGGGVSSETVTIQKGEKKVVTLTIKSGEGGEPAKAGAAGAPAGAGSSAPPPADGGSKSSTQRTAGLVIAGVGAAGIVVGAITGALTLGKKSTISNNCNLDTKVCNADGSSAVSSAQTTGAVSTIGFIAGTVLAAGGVVLFVTAPKSSAPTTGLRVNLGPTGGFLSAGGAF